ncbi:Sjogren'S syndrome/scleroderma autoantigen 1, partial [Onchocerca flexuosa]
HFDAQAPTQIGFPFLGLTGSRYFTVNSVFGSGMECLWNCMGHHQFDITSRNKSLKTETDIADQIEGMDLNGLQRVTQEHQQLLEQTRHSLRDRISSRMGELLLLGQTMLNEYCELCAGILMEDRQGVRCCVACDMVNQELSRAPNDRILVANNNDLNDLNDTVIEQNSMNRSNEVLQSPAQFSSANSPTRLFVSINLFVRNLRNRRRSVEDGLTQHVGSLRSRSVKMAVHAVDDKLRWCAERLKSCENVEEVMKLYEAIDRGIRILEHFMDT